MIRVKQIAKDFLEAGAMNSLIGLFGFIGNHVFLTKGGDLGIVIGVAGVDAECLDHAERDQIARRFESATRIFDERFRVYQYLLKRDHAPVPHRHYENPVVEQAITNRIEFLEARSSDLYTVEIFFVLMYEGWHRKANIAERLRSLLNRPRATLAEMLSAEKGLTVLEDDLHRACELLTNKAGSFVIQLQDALGVELLDRGQAFQFLRRLLNFAPYKLEAGIKYDTHLDYFACDSALECHRDHLKLDDYFVQVLTLKEPPAQTFADVLQALAEIPSNYIIVSEWKRESNAAVRKEIHSKRRHFHNSKASLTNYLSDHPPNAQDLLIDDGAAGLVADLGGCLREIEINGNSFGKFSLAIVLYDADRAKLRRAVAECFKVFSTQDAVLIEERYNLLNAFLSIVPGNQTFNLRRLWLINTNYADLSFLFTLHTGAKHNAHLGQEYLAVLETNSSTPYFLNLHYQDIAHTMILGATGSGKSFFLNFLITNVQKYQPLTYLFDLGGSYQSLTQLFGGSYVQVGIERRSFTINPFRLPPTQENLHFLFSFVRVLIESSGYTLTGQDERDLYQQIENLYEIDPEQRRLFTLANILRRNLAQHLHKWVEGGQYGTLFDNVEDNLTLATFQTFDFEGMNKYPQVLEPMLFYILHRANASIYDPALDTTFKVFVMDEAWRFLKNDTIRQYITEAVKTWRKRNAAMVLATQSSDDLERSQMLSVIVESCATKMFMANPGMDRRVYRETFHPLVREAAGATDELRLRHAEVVDRWFTEWEGNWRERQDDFGDLGVALDWALRQKGESALKLGRRIGDNGFRLGYRIGRLPEALEICEKFIRSGANRHDKRLLQVSYGNKALIFDRWGRLEEALALLKEHEGLCQQLGSRDGLQASYGNQARILNDWGRLEEALALFKKQEATCQELGNRDGLQTSYGNQAVILRAWGRSDEALALHEKETAICEELGNREGLQRSYGNQAIILQQSGRLEDALALLRRKEVICEDIGNRNSLTISYLNQAQILRLQGKLDEALELLSRTEKLAVDLGARASVAYCYLVMAEIYLRRRALPEARMRAAASLEILSELKIHRHREEVSALLNKIEAEIGSAGGNA